MSDSGLKFRCVIGMGVGLDADTHSKTNPESCLLNVLLGLIMCTISLHVELALSLFVLITERVGMLLLSLQSVAVITWWYNLR